MMECDVILIDGDLRYCGIAEQVFPIHLRMVRELLKNHDILSPDPQKF